MSLLRALCALLMSRTGPIGDVAPAEPLRPSEPVLSPIHPRAGWAEGTEPAWMTRWDMWADALYALPKSQRGAA